MNPPKTSWRLLRVPDWDDLLEVELSVDTTAPQVVEAIEDAARYAGVRIERIEPDAG